MKNQRKEMAKDLLWFYRKQAVLLCGIFTVIGVFLAAGLAMRGEAAGVQQGIASEILRFHVSPTVTARRIRR